MRRTVVLALMMLVIACQAQPAPRPSASSGTAAVPELAEGRGAIYLPIISHASPLATPTIAPTPDPIATCFNNPRAMAFHRSLIADSRQQRTRIDCHPALMRAARARAESLISRDYWAHCDPDGVCPNLVARRAGCRLPSDYGDRANYIEELGAGTPDPAVMFTALGNSPAHKTHLFGEIDFYRRQPHVGIVLVEGGRWGWVWVVLIGTCGAVSGE